MGGTKLVLEAYLKLSCTDFEKVSNSSEKDYTFGFLFFS